MLFRLISTFLLLATAATTNAAMDFTGASWIWGVDGGVAPPPLLSFEQVAFRKDFVTPTCTPPTSVEVIITADDSYTLYVNGVEVGSGANWGTPQYYCVLTNPLDILNVFQNRVVIAVLGANTVVNTGAALLAKVKVNYFGGGSDEFVTDGSWVTFTSTTTVPNGFQSPNFDDRTWSAAVVEELYNGGPSWGPVLAPANQTCSLCSSHTTILTV